MAAQISDSLGRGGGARYLVTSAHELALTYKWRGGGRKMTCQEFVAQCQWKYSPASLWVIVEWLSEEEMQVWEDTDCVPLYDELVHITDPWNLRTEYEVLTV